MVQRIETPDMPPRDVLVNFHLVVRESCGARAARELTAR
jgi:DNA-binding LacI/PurR family transcriptional regulator